MQVLTTAPRPLPHRYEPALEPAMLPEIERGVKAWWEGLPPPPRARSFPNKKVSVLSARRTDDLRRCSIVSDCMLIASLIR